MNQAMIMFLVSISMMMTPVRNLRGQYLSIPQTMKIEKQVDSTFQAMIKAAEIFDFNKLIEGVDDTNRTGFIMNGTYFSDFDSLVNQLKERTQGARQTIMVREKKVTALSDKIAVLTAHGDTYVNLSNGNSFQTKFFWSFVFQRNGNKWKVIQSHQSGAQ